VEDDDNNNEKQAQQVAEVQPTLPPGWCLDLKIAPDAEGELGGVAELWQGEELRCRLVLTRYGRDRAAAVQRVHARVEYWLSEWSSRTHTGDTEFGELE
jgi:hypothetical protein